MSIVHTETFAALGPPVLRGTHDVLSLASVFELVLRHPEALSRTLAKGGATFALAKRLLSIGIFGLWLHGLAVGAVAEWFGLIGFGESSVLFDGHPLLWMPLALVLAFLGTLAVCLPSFYFYTQLSGLDASFRLTTAQALRTQATTSVLLLGVLPIYFALALASLSDMFFEPDQVVFIGLLIPFLMGLFGVRALYRGFVDLLAFVPITHERRGNFLRRMVVAWSVLYTSVAPVALYRLVQQLSQVL